MKRSVCERSELRKVVGSFFWAIVLTAAGCSRDLPPASPPASQSEGNGAGQGASAPVSVTEPKKDAGSSAAEGDPRNWSSVGDLVARYDDAVLFIKSQDALGETVAVGTGCIVDKSGIIATNRHVVSDAARAVAQFRDGKESPVIGWVAVDKHHDLVLLKLGELPDDVEWFSPGPIEVRQGDELIAIGHPSEFRFTVTEGIVSALRTTKELPELYREGLHSNPDTRWVQTTAAISGGSSGGPLLSRTGELVGLNTWIAAGQNLGFAVHVDHLIELLQGNHATANPLPLPDTDVISDADVARIMNDFMKEYRVLHDNLRYAAPEDRLQIIERQNPIPIYLDRFAEHAASHPQTAGEFESLRTACAIFHSDSKQAREKFQLIAQRLVEHYLGDPRMEQVAATLAQAPPADEVKHLLRQIMAKGVTPQVRGTACHSLAMILLGAAPEGLNASPEAIEILERAIREYGDVTVSDAKLAEVLAPLLFKCRHLSLNRPAPEIVGTDMSGEPFRLSDYRGKVVVLDFWADWCPHCRAMYGDERRLVEKYPAEKFAILGINCDDRARADSVIKSGQVTWRSWYDGPQGPIGKEWQIEGFPTVYVLDTEGTIRFESVRGPQLDDAVSMLLEEPLLQLPMDLVATGEAWKYHGNGADLGTSWRELDTDDSSWPSGKSPLGYGLGNEATSLAFGNMDNKHITAYFRKKFAVVDPAKIGMLVLGISVDDGAAVYLNGVEIFRTRLAASATYQTVAVQEAPLHGQYPSLYVVDPKLLRAGDNLVAVEVHQESPTSADLRFDVTLSSRMPQWPPLPELQSASSRSRACNMLRQLGPLAAARVEELKELADDSAPVPRVDALMALHAICPADGNGPIPASRDDQETAYRKHVSRTTNNYFWPIVESADRSSVELDRAVLMLDAAFQLTPTDGAICNTLAVAQYRTGQFEKALASARLSISLQKESPYDLAIVAMSTRQLGRSDEASEAMAALKGLMLLEEWSGNVEAGAFVQEAEQLFTELSHHP